MNFGDLLVSAGVNPQSVIVLRHRPFEPKLNRVLPWLAAERPELFNAYQQTQSEKLEKAMLGASHIASFIGNASGKALFIGLYKIGQAKPLTWTQYWQVPAYQELRQFDLRGFTEADAQSRPAILWFDLEVTDFCAAWKGKLVVGWPPPERSWWRRAHRNEFAVLAIHEDSALDPSMKRWDEITFSWAELAVLPARYKSILQQWRGIYLIFDSSDGKSYVGSAYGKDNLLGRWTGYVRTGHGENKLLRTRDPLNFQFSILERVSPDMKAEDVQELESSWKLRLHTRQPFGLNEN